MNKIMNCDLTPVDFCHVGLHTEVLLKLKQGPGLSPSNQDTPCAQLTSVHLGWNQLPSAEPPCGRDMHRALALSMGNLFLLQRLGLAL